MSSYVNIYKYVHLHSERTLSPFCNILLRDGVGPPVRTCSVDRDLFAVCNLIEYAPGIVPPEFQVLWRVGSKATINIAITNDDHNSVLL